MYLEEIFTQLVHGELKPTIFGSVDGQTIDPCNYPQIIPHINMAMTAIYKRFPVKLKTLSVQQYDHIVSYTLHKDYAVSNSVSTQPVKYIQDSIQPFDNDLLKIEQVFNEIGEEYYLNNDKEKWSLFTPSYNVLQVPYPDSNNQMEVMYRAKHPNINLVGLTPETYDIDIPEPLLEAFLLYIASRVFTSMGGDYRSVGMSFMNEFEQSCLSVEQAGLVVSDNNSNTKFGDNGWV